MIPRKIAPVLARSAEQFRVVTLTGPRQSGKTTLCRAVFAGKPYHNLERPDVLAAVREDPVGFLGRLADGAVLDEVQRFPELLSYLQAEVDERPSRGRFILTGSHNLALMNAVSQSLAGRTALLELLPMAQDELAAVGGACTELMPWLWRGSFPEICAHGAPVSEWLAAYTATFIERDVRQLLQVGDLRSFATFLRLCAGRTGRLLEVASLARDAGIAHGTAKAWLSVLEASYVVQLVPAWHGNTTKRLVKAPKLHFLDTGLCAYLLGIRGPDDLWSHPLRGNLFESWVAAECAKYTRNRGLPNGLWHARDDKGREIDLVLDTGDRLLYIEAKSGATVPAGAGKSLAAAVAMVDPGHFPGRQVGAGVVFGGDGRWPLGQVEAVGWAGLVDWLGGR